MYIASTVVQADPADVVSPGQIMYRSILDSHLNDLDRSGQIDRP